MESGVSLKAGEKIITSSVSGLATAAAAASRKLQSLSQTPSLVSAVLVTVKIPPWAVVAAAKNTSKKISAMTGYFCSLFFPKSRLVTGL